MTTLREEKLDEEDRVDWMESYLKSRGLKNLVAVACSSEASFDEPKKSVIQKMIEHNNKVKAEKAKRKPKRSNAYRYTNYDVYDRFSTRNKYSNRGAYW